jgi:hypothetical protein
MAEKFRRDEILAQIPAARAAGRRAQREPWWPVSACYDRGCDALVIGLRDGKSLTVPRSHVPELADATGRQVDGVELIGEALRWDALDVDVSVPGLISELLGPSLSTQSSGRLGGKARSRAKAAAARRNGRKGGRPRRGS